MPTLNEWMIALNTPRSITVESSPALLASIQAKQKKENARLQAKGRSPASQKSGLTVVPQFAPWRTAQLAPVHLLHRLGVITTPVVPNLTDICSTWAYIRYLWAFNLPDGTPNDPLRLSDEAFGIDFHQKGLMSDEIGVGMAAYVMAEYFNVPDAADVDVVVKKKLRPAKLVGATSPDYLFFNAEQTIHYVVECKGTRSSRSAALEQLRRGTEQVPSFRFTDGRQPPTALVIGTRLTSEGTEVLVVDPPPDDEQPEHVIKRGPKDWTISDSGEFQRIVGAVSDLKILRYAAADQAVENIAKQRWPDIAETWYTRPRPTTIRENMFGEFSGVQQTLPFLNGVRVEAFQGIRRGVLTARVGADPATLSASLDWLDGLVCLLDDWQREASPGQWADRLDRVLDQVLAAGDGRFDSTAAVDLVGQLRAAETDHACEVDMDAAAVADWLDQVAQEEVRAVSRVGGNMAMGGFKPMRAIPCRVLAIMGLHDAAFPRRARAPAWDLLAAAPRRGDRDPVREDRQLFLDALLAAGDRVIVTATARNIRSNKDEPLSACVDEFLRVAAATVSDHVDIRETTYRDLIEDHPLQPFNAACFTGPRASFDTGHLEIACACQQREEEVAPFQVGVFELPEAVQSADLELHEMIRILKDPWLAWLGSLGVEIPQAGDDPFALDREPVAAPAGLDRWQLQTTVIDAVLEGRTSFLEERLAANRLLPYGILGAAMGRRAVQEAESLARHALHEAGGRLQPQRLVYRDGCPPVAGNIAVTPDRRLHVLVRPTDLKAAAHHRLDVWVRATFAAACGMRGDSVVVSREGERTRVDRRPALAPDQARAALDHLLHLCAHARRYPLPFGPKTSSAVFAAGQRGVNETDKAMKAWHQQPQGPPGEGDSASARLTWRDRDPFSEEIFDEWRRVAAAVFGPVEAQHRIDVLAQRFRNSFPPLARHDCHLPGSGSASRRRPGPLPARSSTRESGSIGPRRQRLRQILSSLPAIPLQRFPQGIPLIPEDPGRSRDQNF